MPLEGDWQLPELARSVALPVLRLPTDELQSQEAISAEVCPSEMKTREDD